MGTLWLGQCIWYRSMQSSSRSRRLFSAACSTWSYRRLLPSTFVATNTLSRIPLMAAPTASSVRYISAVSTRVAPSSMPGAAVPGRPGISSAQAHLRNHHSVRPSSRYSIAGLQRSWL